MYVYINLFIIFFYCILILLIRIRPCEKKKSLFKKKNIYIYIYVCMYCIIYQTIQIYIFYNNKKLLQISLNMTVFLRFMVKIQIKYI